MIYQSGDTLAIGATQSPVQWSTPEPGYGPTEDFLFIDSYRYSIQPDGSLFCEEEDLPLEYQWTGRAIVGYPSSSNFVLELSVPTAPNLWRTRVRVLHGPFSLAGHADLQQREAFIDIWHVQHIGLYYRLRSCCLDPRGQLFAAVDVRDGLEIRRFASPAGSTAEPTITDVQVMSVIPNACEGLIAFEPGGVLWCFANITGDPTDPATTWNEAPLQAWRSSDAGRTWDVVPLPAHLATEQPTPPPSAQILRAPRARSFLPLPGTLRLFRRPHGSSGALEPHLAHRGLAWEEEAQNGWNQKLMRGHSWHSSPQFLYTPQGTVIEGQPIRFIYNFWRVADGFFAEFQPITNRTTPPQGPLVPNPRPGLPARFTWSHVLHHGATNELHLTDGIGYWASSPDMGRSWRPRF